MINIAVDGFSGSGKGELCKGLASRLNLKHLDTGAILRAIGMFFYNQGFNEVSEKLVEDNLENINIKVEFDGNRQITFLNNDDVSTEIRQEIFGQMASRVAVHQKAMMKLIEICREFAKNYNCIMDGRNITSEVLPDADVKFFLTASLDTRAKRRHNEALKRGLESDLEEVKTSLAERDYRDTHRSFSPMIQTDDSFVVDNTNMSILETIDYCYDLAMTKLEKANKLI